MSIFFKKNQMIANKLESKENFQSKVERYFIELSCDQIPSNLIYELIDNITNYVHNNYERFWEQYPKSRKRYSVLKIEDLEHPFVRYIIIDFFKTKAQSDYKKFSKILLKMNDEELMNYEIRKYQYETR